jgi:hypothetical protein
LVETESEKRRRELSESLVKENFSGKDILQVVKTGGEDDVDRLVKG